MTSRSIDHAAPVQAAIVIHPFQPRGGGLRSPAARLEEAAGLAAALDLEVVATEATALRATAPATLFGRGTVERISGVCADRDIDVVVVDDALTPVQQRNLEKAWKTKVLDRTGLILEIFARRARTREGRLQVELARLTYERSRLVRTWTHLERQRGGFGVMGGPGETQIETDRRLLAARMARIKKDLEEVRRTRGLQRRARKRAPSPTVALVGYTNAGKSTLFNRLTNAGVIAQDLLFATLDPTMRTLRLPGGRPVILSDTVGFISDLPHELVEAFRATLEEVAEADVILHVRDLASPDTDAQAEDVEQVLRDILPEGESCGQRIEVWNKIDLLEPAERDALAARAERASLVGGEPVAPVSAVTGEGLDRLLELIASAVDPEQPFVAELPPGDGRPIAWLYRHGRILSRDAREDGGLSVSVRLDGQALGRFERLFPDIRVAHPH